MVQAGRAESGNEAGQESLTPACCYSHCCRRARPRGHSGVEEGICSKSVAGGGWGKENLHGGAAALPWSGSRRVARLKQDGSSGVRWWVGPCCRLMAAVPARCLGGSGAGRHLQQVAEEGTSGGRVQEDLCLLLSTFTNSA